MSWSWNRTWIAKARVDGCAHKTNRTTLVVSLKIVIARRYHFLLFKANITGSFNYSNLMDLIIVVSIFLHYLSNLLT